MSTFSFFPSLKKMMQENVAGRIALLLAGGGILALCLVMGGTHMLVSTMRVTRSEGGLREKDQIALRYERLITDLKATAQDRTALFALRPSASSPVVFLQHLERLATDAGIQQTITAETTDHPEFHYPVPLLRYTITLTGPLDRMIVYIKALSALPELTRVEHVRVTSSDPSPNIITTGEGEITVAVAVQTHTSPLPSSPTP